MVGALLIGTNAISYAAPAPSPESQEVVPYSSLRFGFSSEQDFLELRQKLVNINSFEKASAFIAATGKVCKKYELPTLNGCGDETKIMKDALKELKDAPDATSGEFGEGIAEAVDTFKAALTEQLDEIEASAEAEYAVDEPLETISVTPTDVLTAYPERAMVNPFDQMADWVSFWESGKFLPKIIRTNPKFGAKLIIKLTKKFCNQLEIRGTDGCPDELKVLKNAIKAGRTTKIRRLSIVDIYKKEMVYLSEIFEDGYGGEDRVNAQEPADVTGSGDPFAELTKQVKWWDEGSFYPEVLRLKYAKNMIPVVKKYCDQLSVPDKDGCPDTLDSMKKFIKRFPKKPALNKTKSEIVDTFSDWTDWLSEQYNLNYQAPDDTAPNEEEEEEEEEAQ